ATQQDVDQDDLEDCRPAQGLEKFKHSLSSSEKRSQWTPYWPRIETESQGQIRADRPLHGVQMDLALVSMNHASGKVLLAASSDAARAPGACQGQGDRNDDAAEESYSPWWPEV